MELFESCRHLRVLAIAVSLMVLTMTRMMPFLADARYVDTKEQEIESFVRQNLPAMLERSLADSQLVGFALTGKQERRTAAGVSSDELKRDKWSNQANTGDNFGGIHKKEASVPDNSEDANGINDGQKISSDGKWDEQSTNDRSVDTQSIDDRLERLFPRIAKRLVAIDKIRELFGQDIENNTLSAEESKLLSSVSLECHSRCDVYDNESRTCWFERQVGDTVTLRVRPIGTANLNFTGKISVQWVKVKHNREKSGSTMEKLTSSSGTGNDTSNIVIGSAGTRLRISPIKDVDMDYNTFQAALKAFPENLSADGIVLNYISFRIRIVPIDMGFVYHGEEITIAIENFMTLPMPTLIFDWMVEKTLVDTETLPPNMRVRHEGQTLVITELSNEQEGIISCAIYSPDGFFLAKRRFLIREPALLTRDITPKKSSQIMQTGNSTKQPPLLNVTYKIS